MITTASNIDIGLLIDPILCKEEPWISKMPTFVFAACIAEIVFHESRFLV